MGIKLLSSLEGSQNTEVNSCFVTSTQGMSASGLTNIYVPINVTADTCGLHVGNGTQGIFIKNNTTSGFEPTIKGQANDITDAGLSLLGMTSGDSGSGGAVIINAKTQAGATLANRDLLHVQNNGVSSVCINKSGHVKAVCFCGGLAGTATNATNATTANNATCLGGVGATAYLRSDENDAKTAGYLRFEDNVQLYFGAACDLQLYHDATNSIINNTTGNLRITSNGENAIVAIPNSCTQLYYDNAAKFTTISGGTCTFGTHYATTFDGCATNSALLDSLDSSQFLRSDAVDIKTAGNLTFNDNICASFGTDSDMCMFHDGASGFIKNSTGTFYIRTAANETAIAAVPNSCVALNYDTVTKFTTISGGTCTFGTHYATTFDGNLTGLASLATSATTALNATTATNATCLGGVVASSYLRSDAADIKTSGNLTFNDNISALFGTSGDMTIQHDGSNSFVNHTGTGSLYIQSANNLFLRNNAETALRANVNSCVSLYYDNAEKFKTVAGGTCTTGIHIASTNLCALGCVRGPFVYSEGAACAATCMDTPTMCVTSVLSHNATASYDKIRVWDSNLYTIGMQNGLSFGSLGTDYAMTFTMNNAATRGFLWRDVDDAATDGAMSLTTDGKLCAKTHIYTPIACHTTCMRAATVCGTSLVCGGTIRSANHCVGAILLQDSTDRAGLLEINCVAASSWAGTQTVFGTAKWSLMGNQTQFGMYDDDNSKWAWCYNENAENIFNYNGAAKFYTLTDGTCTAGVARASSCACSPVGCFTTCMRATVVCGSTCVSTTTARAGTSCATTFCVPSTGVYTAALTTTGVRLYFNLACGCAIDFIAKSDCREKKCFTHYECGLDKVNQLNPIYYEWCHNDEKDMGFLAQEVMDVEPTLVTGSEEDGYGLKYDKFAALSVKAIQELSCQLKDLKAEVERLKQ